jgi:NAD(P)-dependent dehydrogenase (short-subunit alcohol dehydrogenase family)
MSAGAAEDTRSAHGAPAGGSLSGQTVVVLGASAGMGFETARLARAHGAEVVLTARNPDPLERASRALGAREARAFDAGDTKALDGFFDGLQGPVDHIMVTAGRPDYGTFSELGAERAREALAGHQLLSLEVARHAQRIVRPGGSLILIGGTGGRRPRSGYAIVNAVTAAMPALTASLALEIAPVRVNLIAPGFVDTPLSATILGPDLEERRAQLRRTLPIGRVVGPRDVASLAVELMVNTAVTGATFDIDGGQQLVE